MSRARDLGSLINSTAAGKNLVINGNFEISQRYSNPSTLTYCNSNMYFVDRWCPHQFQSAMLARTSITAGSGPSSRYALRVGSVSLAQEGYGSRMVVAQKVESINTYPLRGQRITLSFWIRFSNSNFTSLTNSTDSTYGNFSYMVQYNTSTTDAPLGSTGGDSQNWAEIANNNTTGSLPTSWTKIVLSGVVPTNANNLLVRFGMNALGSTTSAGQYWYEIADVQLEAGSSATPFSLAGGDIQGELAKCQRYYETNYPSGTTPGTTMVSSGFDFAGLSLSAKMAVGGTTGTNRSRSEVRPFLAQKRVTPTIQYWDWVGNTSRYSGGNSDGSRSNDNLAVDQYGGPIPTEKTLSFQTVASSSTISFASIMWAASAEL